MKVLKFALGLLAMVLLGFGGLLVVARFSDGPLVPLLVAERNRKYAAGMRVEDVEQQSLWFFELTPDDDQKR